jgi:PhnO protein
MNIRKCEPSDSKEVYSLICELEDTEFNMQDFEIAFTSKLNNSSNYYIVCIEDNKIIGFLGLHIDYQLHHVAKVAMIEELVVSNKNRSQGVGKLLLEKAIQYARENNCEVIELTSSFPRERAHQFYIKNGFEKSGYKFKMELEE